MARLLTPEDFGVLAMASVFTGIVFFVLDLGLGAALVQRQKLEEHQISSVFWMNVSMGFVLTLLGMASSWAIAGFYKNSAVQPVIAALSCNFVIFSLSSTQLALLKRQMNFRSLELRTLVGQFFGITCSLAMAFLGLGVWSLVGRILIAAGIETALLWSISSWRPSWGFSWADVRELSGFSSEVFAANLLGYVGRNADNFLIGRFVGATELGYYAMAYNLMMFPVQRFSQLLSGVLFPVLSRLQENLEKVKSSWFRATRLIAAFTVPLMLGLIALAPQFVRVVYGEKWLPAVPLLQILAVSGINQSLVQLNATVLLALGKTRLRLKLTVLAVSLAIISFLVGLPFGVIGVAACFTVANTVSATLILLKTLECLDSSYFQYICNLSGTLAAAGGMCIAVLALGLGLPIASAPLLAIAIPSGCVVYLTLLRFIAPSVLNEAFSMLPERFTRPWLKLN